MTAAILIKSKCKKCGETQEILIPTHKLEQYLAKNKDKRIFTLLSGNIT